MHVSERTAAARVTYRDAVYLFCSFDCARAFTSTPEQYA
jgi:YHS domain-containing protein